MRRFGKWLGRVILAFFVLFAGIWLLVPLETVDRKISFDANSIGADLDAYLKADEQQFSDITPGTEKRIIWAGVKGVKTPLAVIYLHGFSATSEEIRPVPDQVAQALGANLLFTRLAGHGRGSAAMATATAGDWIEDMAQAMAIGRRLGERVVVIGTSTGGTLAAIAATDPQLSADMAGIVLVSPNFGLQAVTAKILDMPAARYWGPIVAGKTISFVPANDGQAKYWTTSYPTLALFPMAALVRQAQSLDYSAVKIPLLLFYAPKDQVVNPAKTLAALASWGGRPQIETREMGPGDDAMSHVIAGEVLSPGQTTETVALIVAWAKGL